VLGERVRGTPFCLTLSLTENADSSNHTAFALIFSRIVLFLNYGHPFSIHFVFITAGHPEFRLPMTVALLTGTLLLSITQIYVTRSYPAPQSTAGGSAWGCPVRSNHQKQYRKFLFHPTKY
jgi:hypothetical protein